jgi:myo-inositol-1-phosphate synthase
MPQAVRVGIVGVGNCASSLVQGVAFYHDAKEDEFVPGLMRVSLGGYHVRDIEFSAAFDVSAAKVGHDLGEAVIAPPNNTYRFCEVGPLGVRVQRGPTMDGLGMYLRGVVPESKEPAADVAAVLRESGTQVLVSYLPVGSQKATEFYAEQALSAGCAFVNCVPVFIASRGAWRARFERAGLPLIGDDVKSQVGATITHRVLTSLFRQRGVRLDRTYQLNFGGNTDFLNMLERSRLASKKVSKTRSVTSQLGHEVAPSNIHVGPSDYVPWLEDRKFCYIRMEGTTFGGVPIACELKLEVWDSPNSAGVVIDAVRCAKLALDRGIGGALIGPSSAFMKSPPEQFTDVEAHERTEAFIREAASSVRATLTPPPGRGASGPRKPFPDGKLNGKHAQNGRHGYTA